MSSQNTFGKVRLNDKVESRVRGDLYARFGGECLETYHCNKWQGAGCLAYEMQEIQDKTRVESLLSQFRYKEADMICRKYEGMGYPYFIYASARVEMDRENYKGARERLENVIHLFYKDVQNEYYYYLGETYFYLEEFELAGRYVLKAMEVLQSKSSLPGLDSSKKDLRIIDETCTSSQYTLSRYSCLLGRIYLSTIQGDSPENNNTFEKALSAFAEALR